ncbi:MAG: HEAT repeat domain-containing protein [Gemmatimonadaceae bacterium]|nr:HEAT repeat domain-containing protein [Gemmatimonadaceae bacterium]NUQ93939.1 HEAT repeat domain-containing protein [Gemmatimonadaceae bacterium]NUR20217.1 HEAT repeat domain-containing protein [Gemmatimonadaceae bacterium]NUS95824.1 HEAT repeat domain-containing protein [Gemmatimonadaceae bacterium]
MRSIAIIAVAALAAAAPRAEAQSLASRVATASGREVRMSYAVRSGVCGDRHDGVSVDGVFFLNNTTETYGRWNTTACETGPARVAVRVGANGADFIQVRVGGSWNAGGASVTDLGTVSAPEAARYFLDLAERTTGRAGRRVLLAATIADSIDVTPRLVQIAQRSSASSDVRHHALMWVGMLGDTSYVQPLLAMARAGDEGDLGGAAAFALSRLRDGAGVPALIDLARTASNDEVRERAVFWLGQLDDKRGREEVRAIAADTRAPEGVRAKAVFALGHSDAAAPEDFRFLRDLFDKAGSEDIQNQILMAMSQSDDQANQKWLLTVARDERAPVETRKKAIFWAGQSDAASTADIAAVYDGVKDEEVKEHVIFVLSQRDDKAATDKLLSIVRGNDDGELRKKALFWLAQKHDPAITRMIADIITKQ